MQAFYSSLTMIWAQAPQCLGARKYSFFKQEGAYTQRRGLAFQMIIRLGNWWFNKNLDIVFSKTSPRFTYVLPRGSSNLLPNNKFSAQGATPILYTRPSFRQNSVLSLKITQKQLYRGFNRNFDRYGIVYTLRHMGPELLLMITRIELIK